MARKLPSVLLRAGGDRRVRAGHPWAFSNEVLMDAETRALPAGSLVILRAPGGEALGLATFNPHSLIAARLLTSNPEAIVDALFFGRRIAQAAALRGRLIGAPYYRLIHAEADGLPAVIVDRFGEALVVQVNSAGMEALTPVLLEALEAELSPRTIVLKNDSPVRELEGLRREVVVTKGEAGAMELIENGAKFVADLSGGQKTGWFYDQRDNRRFMAGLAKDASVLDVYSYSGGFGVLAARAGAQSVICIDRSQAALDAASQAAKLNGVGERVSFQKGEAFEALESLGGTSARKFGVVICDPPAFVKGRKDLKTGAQGYRKLVRLAAPLVARGGFFFVASCSHLMDPALFAEQVRRGLRDGERTGRILRSSGAALDHPVHPNLPETAYLKALTLQLD
ncbi:class I SAM-dependent rRNA methyltransferase [Enhydrobacter sp.]|uniref:class I SAM-dependent rRNA methyltransferase n=1 Tax=Enhydrobacter sp. TaxID=1894999 RepID=UPI0026122AB6|nr:class I SAM-dependent rRNA methyltransferase [Enhydrobacter sp.]WIM11367.1 MAG: 23S rRNA (cytosine(1962)-C(5))-methyltransferase [Enhydrobacter sp.]